MISKTRLKKIYKCFRVSTLLLISVSIFTAFLRTISTAVLRTLPQKTRWSYDGFSVTEKNKPFEYGPYFCRCLWIVDMCSQSTQLEKDSVYLNFLLEETQTETCTVSIYFSWTLLFVILAEIIPNRKKMHAYS